MQYLPTTIWRKGDKDRAVLMRIDELQKFSDGMLNDIRNALDDRLKGIQMQYLPTTIWRKGDKDRAAAMIQAIDKMLKTRRIMRSLERFVGGRLLLILAGSGSGDVNPDKVQRKRDHSVDQDPSARSDQGKIKRRKGTDVDTSKKSSTLKDKIQTGSSKGKTPPKTSKSSKSVTVEEPAKEPVQKVPIDVEEPIMDDVINDAKQPQDKVSPKTDNSSLHFAHVLGCDLLEMFLAAICLKHSWLRFARYALGCVLPEIWNTLLWMYAKLGEFRDAYKVFDEMPMRNNDGAFDFVIDRVGVNGTCEDVVVTFEKMAELCYIPNVHSLYRVIRACIDLNSIEKGRFVHNYVTQNRIGTRVFKLFICLRQYENMVPNVVTFLALLSTIGHANEVGIGMSIHGNVIFVGLYSNVQLGTIIFDMYAKCDRLDFAKIVFEQDLLSKTLVS
nr:hypothetical protein [Tanacetum cinerariifolium]